MIAGQVGISFCRRAETGTSREYAHADSKPTLTDPATTRLPETGVWWWVFGFQFSVFAGAVSGLGSLVFCFTSFFSERESLVRRIDNSRLTRAEKPLTQRGLPARCLVIAHVVRLPQTCTHRTRQKQSNPLINSVCQADPLAFMVLWFRINLPRCRFG